MSLGLFITLDSFRGYTARSEVDTVVGLLTRARSRAMTNTEQSQWGLCISGSSYLLFKGSSCTAGPSSESMSVGPGAVLSAMGTIVFDQLSGDTSASTFTITQQGRTSTISLNHEGTIIW